MKKLRNRFLSWCLAMAMVLTMMPTVFAAEAPSFMNGPYLLCPETTGMTVAWESDQDVVSTISYAEEGQKLGEPIIVAKDDSAPSNMNIYYRTLEGLKPGTKYQYEVKLQGGEVCSATFSTLAENPEEINFMTISDTHKFETKDAFNEAVFKNDPAFILNGGDNVEGTGTQVEQFSFWFNSGEFIHHYPVVYACGNHDVGEYFKSYVLNIQDRVYHAKAPGNVSFDYGTVHVSVMDSNPWGLFEMNAETSGSEMDPSTAKQIEDSVKWLCEDLEAAKDQDFRILIMHHPKSDPYTERHIVPIAEKYHVDLMLAGHTHSYARYISSDPTVGADTVYVTQHAARTSNWKGAYLNIHKKGDILTCENMTDTHELSKMDGSKTVLGKGKQQITLSDISVTPDNILSNSEVSITATVKNVGKGLAAAVFTVDDNGKTRYVYDFTDNEGKPANKLLEPGESKTFTGTILLKELGKHTLKIGNYSKDVEVLFREPTFKYSNLRTKLGNAEKSDINSDQLYIKADVTNIGNETGTGSTSFKVDGKEITSKWFKIAADETKTVEFSYDFDSYGEHAVTIGDLPEQTIYIEGGIQGMPLVPDKSGLENNGYIHGSPELGQNEAGDTTIILDGKKDYIEIPDNQNFKTNDGITGMVWAKLPVSEGPGLNQPQDHNPLLMKGVSIGWGTNYLYRMAVRSTGKITYGIGFADDNGEFFWNDDDNENTGIQKGKWVQYTGGFDRATGGDSYENCYASGHIDPPIVDAEIKNWPGASTYIGFSYKGTLMPNRGRGVTTTWLPGEISQARLYTSKISEEENTKLYNDPKSAGESADNLAIWLDFNNIETTGKHTTEWVSTEDNLSKLHYSAELSGNAKISAMVQLSDNQKTVKTEKSFDLVNGESDIDLSKMGKAKYARIITTFVSDLNETNTILPVLKEYKLTAGKTTSWNTLTEWNRGTFDKAVGHQTTDVYRDISSDFDDYSDKNDNKYLPFNDIEPNSWYESAVSYVYAKDLMVGLTDTMFGASAPTNRAMIAQILYSSKGKPAVSGSAAFKDVKPNDWFYNAVQWANQNGVVSGYEDHTFRPYTNISREQLAVMLYALEGKPSVSASLDDYIDAKSVHSWAENAMKWAVENEIICGVAKDGKVYLDPTGETTRAQIAVMIQSISVD